MKGENVHLASGLGRQNSRQFDQFFNSSLVSCETEKKKRMVNFISIQNIFRLESCLPLWTGQTIFGFNVSEYWPYPAGILQVVFGQVFFLETMKNPYDCSFFIF